MFIAETFLTEKSICKGFYVQTTKALKLIKQQ